MQKTSVVAFMSKYCRYTVYWQIFVNTILLATSQNSSIDFLSEEKVSFYAESDMESCPPRQTPFWQARYATVVIQTIAFYYESLSWWYKLLLSNSIHMLVAKTAAFWINPYAESIHSQSVPVLMVVTMLTLKQFYIKRNIVQEMLQASLRWLVMLKKKKTADYTKTYFVKLTDKNKAAVLSSAKIF